MRLLPTGRQEKIAFCLLLYKLILMELKSWLGKENLMSYRSSTMLLAKALI